jgi:polyphosphate kinase
LCSGWALDRAISAVVRDQHLCLTAEVLPALADYGVALCAWADLSEAERGTAVAYFQSRVRHLLTPLVVDPTHPFPSINSHHIYLCMTLRPQAALLSTRGGGLNGTASARSGSGSSGGSGGRGMPRRVFLKIPGDARLVPVGDDGLRFLPVEVLVRECIGEVCRGMDVVSCHPFRVTRNVKMTLEDADFSDRMDLMETVQGEIHRRRTAPPTRLEIPVGFPEDLRALLIAELGLDDADVFSIDGPMLDLTGLMSVAFVPLPALREVQKEPQVPPRFRGIGDSLAEDPGAIFRVIKERDVMIEHPRDSFDASTLLFLAAAARDPRVRNIKQVIYRAGNNSPLIDALVRAAKNGKEVSVLVELKASFDEVQNCAYANTLQRAGCNVMYGLLGLKVHSKILLVVREEEDGSTATYVNISTGNFNAKTAKLYTDISIMTCHEDLCADMHDVFNSLTGYSRATEFRVALVAPVNMTDRLSEMVRQEAANARAGRPSRIVAQVNGLSDVHIIRELYDASQAGVAIDLFVRGACRLRPGVPGLSENIRVFSWIGPVLQHRRIFYYYADGAEKYFIGSADWRTRNLNDRTEVAIPIFDERNKRRLGKLLTMLKDKRYLWQLQPDGRYYKISALPEAVVFHVQPERVWAHQRADQEDTEATPTSANLRVDHASALDSSSAELANRHAIGAGGAHAVPMLGNGHAGGIGVGGGVQVSDGVSTASGGEDGESARPASDRYLGSPYMGLDPSAFEEVTGLRPLGLPPNVGGPAVYTTGSGSTAGFANTPMSSAEQSSGVPATPGASTPGQTGGVLQSVRPRHRQKAKYKVSIKGNQVQVDKVAAGAVPIRFDDPADISSLQVMMVQRSAADDPWSVPKGGMNEGESPLDAAVRITREKGGVSRSEHFGTIGWVLRPKRAKTIAISTFVLKVLDLGNFVNSLHDRRRKWMTFKEALEFAVGSGNSFTVDSLRRALAFCEEAFVKNAAALEDELTERAESVTSNPRNGTAVGAAPSGDGGNNPTADVADGGNGGSNGDSNGDFGGDEGGEAASYASDGGDVAEEAEAKERAKGDEAEGYESPGKGHEDSVDGGDSFVSGIDRIDWEN